MNTNHKHTNRLIHATSPYLLQHAHNPVEWYEWGEEALTKAKKEDKPILVSIGYSSCHWCHVMERESFENEEIAAIMNEFFICIKVDREERPDIDLIYMEAVQTMGVNGGWPLNVFLTPDQEPFYGGTYFPPRDWAQLLTSIHKTFGLKRIELEASAEDIADVLRRSDLDRFRNNESEATALRTDLDTLYARLDKSFDKVWGGMNKAPKFVMPSTWLMLLRYHHLTDNKEAYDQLVVTLKRIAMGGIHDQLAGGFARYSVDGYWFAPHFEKMLYDNGQLMSLYAEAYAVTKDPELAEVTDGIYRWLMAEMTHPEGGFYSALDADSEGVEGEYYVWTKEELERLLGADAELFNAYFAIRDTGNWEHGKNILMRQKPDSVFIKENNLTYAEWNERLINMKHTLQQERAKRIRPGLDDKIITSWNAMMITGLTDAYRYLGDPRYLKSAIACMEFIRQRLKEDDILYRSYKGKRSTTKGFLDDYAFMIQADLALYQVTFDESYLADATSLMTYCLEHFYDTTEHFFYFGSETDLIARKKEVFDNVIPSSNSVMARNLNLLGLILDRPEWTTMAREMIHPLSQLIAKEPNYMSNWAIALMETKREPAEIVIVGEEAEEFRKELHTHYLPFSLSLGSGKPTGSLPLLSGKSPLDGKTTVYVCFNKTCKRPVTMISQALEQLNEAKTNF